MDRKKMLILTLTRWIDENIHLPLKIEQVAERSGYSRWHLQRMFYQVMKQSLGKYIREKKLTLAAQDLLTGDETVMEISLRYGFESQQSFTRSFSGKYHLPPATFRRQHHPETVAGNIAWDNRAGDRLSPNHCCPAQQQQSQTN
ncbi:helix-turn-helix domain-containing protein [Tatumella sp. JGM16]|nr:helix-turn-helix domain-containing protein [Tatumella sp. JGM16]MBS0911686.1 helix-turn-helix domain-containing protein [Tatumella sp. JGM91]